METFVLVLHIILSFVVVVVILLQSGQGGGLGAGFSSAAAMGQEVFGGRGAASFLGKLTVVLGASFMITSMTLAWYSSKPQSILDLGQEAEDAVDTQVHEIIEEGSAANDPGQINLDSTMGTPGDSGDSPIQLDLDGDGSEIPEDIRRQLEEQFGEGFDAQPADIPEDVEVEIDEGAEPVEEEVEEAPEVEVAPEPAEVEPAQESEPAEAIEEAPEPAEVEEAVEEAQPEELPETGQPEELDEE